MAARIPIDSQALAGFCLRHHIRKLALFGSVLRDDFSGDSDIDVLVEFDAGHVPGLAFFSIEAELSELLRHRVDLHTPQSLSPFFREQVLATSEPQYVAA
jgi:predicted nucleotidyltransferase